MNMKRRFLFATVLLMVTAFVFADSNKMDIPDSTEIRRAAAEAWFYDDVSDLREKRSEIRTNAIGQKFQIRLEETDTTFAVIVAPQMKLSVDLYTENGVEQQVMDEYPVDAKGSWLLIRNSVTGKPECIRLYFSNNSDMFVQLRPDTSSGTNGNKTLCDFVIAGLYASRGVPMGIPFDQLYTASFQQVLLSTEKSLPWKYAETQQGQFHSKMQMIGVIRKNLSRIAYGEDGCYDENGKPVFISDGTERIIEQSDNTKNRIIVDDAGFLKWVADGLVEPVAGSKLYLKPLVVPTVEYNPVGLKGVLAKNRKEKAGKSLSFTLDWCRNLSAACLSVKSQRNYMWYEAYTDVTIEPFCSEVTTDGLTQTAGYIKNSGYKISKLKPLLYVLASTEPTYCYFAAIKNPVKPGETDPEHFEFNQCAVIFPFYDKDGQFACAVFENGQELSINQFAAKHKGSFVHLSRVLTEDTFYPD